MQALRVERDLESLPEALEWEMYTSYTGTSSQSHAQTGHSLEYLEEAGLHILGAWVATESM